METIIIILGQYLLDDGTLSLQCRERCFYGYNLFAEGKGDSFLLTGGQANPKPGISEGQAMKKYLMSLGVGEDKIITEEYSHNTYENARFSSEILKKLTYDKLILVSSSYHIYRWYFNPVRFFNWFFHLKVTPACCMDSLIATANPYDANKQSVFALIENNKNFDEFAKNNSGKNIFYKTVNSRIKKGVMAKKIHNNARDIEMLAEHIKNLYMLEKLEILTI